MGNVRQPNRPIVAYYQVGFANKFWDFSWLF